MTRFMSPARCGVPPEPTFVTSSPTASLRNAAKQRVRDWCPCRVDIDLHDRVFALQQHARPSGLAGLRRLSAWHAVDIHQNLAYIVSIDVSP
jgi:hypothetical protein